jgi:hypothetical protein
MNGPGPPLIRTLLAEFGEPAVRQAARPDTAR